MSLVNQKWVQHQIGKIKCKDYNTSKGHLFELLGVSYFQHKSNQMLPTEKDCPGVDAITTFTDNSKISWSFKNFGISQRQKEFEKRCAVIEKLVEENLKFSTVNNCRLLIYFLQEYPNEQNIWDEINKDIPNIIKQFNGQALNIKSSDNKVAIYVSNENGVYSNREKSYGVIVLAPYHQNEQKNFNDKLDKACANLIKHKKEEDENHKNALFINIPESIHLVTCENWAKEYFQSHAEKPISRILFYRPIVAFDRENTHIVHGIKLITKNADYNMPEIKGEVPIGKISSESHPKVLSSFDGSSGEIELVNKYTYQRGKLYYDSKTIGKETKCEVSKIASGIIPYMCMNVPKLGYRVAMPAIYSPDDKLLIL